ncbi:MAG: AtpZ/AtpI family protein [Microthrixaceae bacterium]|nr:AtpZ/AtpI family protein [Microthrixaceae bacterium]
MPKLSEQIDRGHGGYLLVIAPALFGLLGFWLDGLLGWAPVLTIVGAAYGLAGALYKVISSYRNEMDTQATVRRAARPEPAGRRSNRLAS